MRALCLIISLCLATPTWAQVLEIGPEDPTEREVAEMRVEADMVKMKNLTEALSRNLGQLHYLRTLCFGNQDQQWRDFASKMMNIESGNDSAQRRNLIRAFNSGYYLEKDRFEACSEEVSIDVAAISENARQISGMLGDPYRGF